MDLHKEWQKWQESAELDKKELIIPNLDKLKGNVKTPLQKIKRLFHFQFSLVIVFSILFIYILFTEQEPLILFFIGALLIIYIVMGVLYVKMYQYFLNKTRLDKDIVTTLRDLSQTLRKWTRMSQKTALFIYPIAGAGGFFYGFSLSQDIDKLFESNVGITVMIVFLIINTPLAYYISKWMNKKTLEKYLLELESYIKDFESEPS